MVTKRSKELLAITMIGDGVLAVLQPRRHAQLWKEGPESWQAMVDPLLERPGLTRVLGAASVALGLWLASRQEPNDA